MDNMSVCFAPMCRWQVATQRTHTHMHAHTRALSRTILSHTYTPLLRTSLRHTFVAHADPSPSLFSFLHFPSHLYLSFAAYWKKLTCGVIRSFNYSEFLIIKKSAGSWHWPHCHKNEMSRFRLFTAVQSSKLSVKMRVTTHYSRPDMSKFAFL